MKKRDRQRPRKPERKPAANLPPARAASWERRGWLIAGVLVVALVLTVAYRMWSAPPEDHPGAPIARSGPTNGPDGDGLPAPGPELPVGHKHAKTPAEKSDPESFLDAFTGKDPKEEKEGDAAALSSAELEKQFQALVEVNDQFSALKKRALKPGAFADDAAFAQAKAERDRLLDQLNRRSAALDTAVAAARRARPADAVPRWLSGELLMLVGGEPEEYLPHLKAARAQGLARPRLFASLALAELEANHFTEAYRSAAQAVDQVGPDRYLWNAFVRTAFSTNQFDQVLDRLGRDFPGGLPDWAQASRRDAEDLQAKWLVEQKLRRAEAQADDLPRVRLLIEHRRFGKDANGKPLTTVESTGREEVVLELFENEAPQTVANFVDLVGRRFYDGTRFHLALPATMVAGGDPNSRHADPSEDGAGGPGYVIADEFKAAGARHHFRGALSMVNTGPHSAGSQFFINLVPAPAMDGQFTVFGRVVEGQEAIDRITRGRTTKELGHYGKIIPGDLLVRAEVLRKRSHEYRAVKE